MKYISKQIEESKIRLDIMKYLIDTEQYEYITIMTNSDYLEINNLICQGMDKDLAINRIAIMREYKSLKTKHRMKFFAKKDLTPEMRQRLQDMELFSSKVERVLKVKPKMGIIYGTGKHSQCTFDLRILNQ